MSDRDIKETNAFVLTGFEENIRKNELLKDRPQMRLVLIKSIDGLRYFNENISDIRNINSQDLLNCFNNRAYEINDNGKFTYQGLHEENEKKGTFSFDLKELFEGKLNKIEINNEKNILIDKNESILNGFEKNINESEILKEKPKIKMLLKNSINDFKEANSTNDREINIDNVLKHYLKLVLQKDEKRNFIHNISDEYDENVSFDVKDLLEGKYNKIEAKNENNIINKNDDILCEFESNIRKSDLLKERPQMKLLLNHVIDDFKEANISSDKKITSHDVMNHFIKSVNRRTENGNYLYRGLHEETDIKGDVKFNLKDLLEGKYNKMKNEVKPLENTTPSINHQIELAKKTGYVQGVCECVAAIDDNYTLGKKLLTEMNVNKDMAQKFANPETFKKLEQGIFAQKHEQKLNQKQSFKL